LWTLSTPALVARLAADKVRVMCEPVYRALMLESQESFAAQYPSLSHVPATPDEPPETDAGIELPYVSVCALVHASVTCVRSDAEIRPILPAVVAAVAAGAVPVALTAALRNRAYLLRAYVLTLLV
jgi:hypothetical protein